MLSELFLVAVISFPAYFYVFVESLYRYIYPILNASMFYSSVFFLTHIDSQRYLLDVRPYASCSMLCLFQFFSSSTPRMIQSILQVGHPLCLFPLWDPCYIVWSWAAFLFAWDTLFFFHFQLLDVVRFQYSQVSIRFLIYQRSEFFFLIFHPSYVVCRFLLLAWHIFLHHTPSICPYCIFLLPVRVSNYCSFFSKLFDVRVH